MKRCVQCGHETLRPDEAEDAVTVAGRTFSRMVPVLRCEKCGETYFRGPELQAVELEAAGVIAREGPSDGATFKFMRKALGLRAVELAELLNVAPETLSRWEHAQRPVDRASWIALSAMVLDKLEGRTATLDRLRALLKPGPLPKLVHLVPRAA
jgi:DNA-binding XRE family transcriptional regulator